MLEEERQKRSGFVVVGRDAPPLERDEGLQTGLPTAERIEVNVLEDRRDVVRVTALAQCREELGDQRRQHIARQPSANRMHFAPRCEDVSDLARKIDVVAKGKSKR